MEIENVKKAYAKTLLIEDIEKKIESSETVSFETLTFMDMHGSISLKRGEHSDIIEKCTTLVRTMLMLKKEILLKEIEELK